MFLRIHTYLVANSYIKFLVAIHYVDMGEYILRIPTQITKGQIKHAVNHKNIYQIAILKGSRTKQY
jgi:hypothetical protein